MVLVQHVDQGLAYDDLEALGELVYKVGRNENPKKKNVLLCANSVGGNQRVVNALRKACDLLKCREQ